MIHQFGPAGQDSHERKLTLRSNGPILDVVAKPSSKFAGLNCKALIDTGASVNCIDNNRARKLGLIIIDYKIIQSASGQIKTPVYIGVLDIPELQISISGQFYGAELVGIEKIYHYLLGRPFLSDFIFSYNGPEGILHLAKPSNILTETTFDE